MTPTASIFRSRPNGPDVLWLLLGGLILVALGGGASGLVGISAIARRYLGRPYHLGAGLDDPEHRDYPDPPYLDCGLFTKKIISRALDVSVPRTVTEQVKAAPYTLDVWGKSRETVAKHLQEGVFIATDSKYAGGGPQDRYTHTGMATDTGKVIHASYAQKKVIEVPLAQFAKNWRTLYAWQPIP